MQWTSRYLNDELWLRSRRLLTESLRRSGLDSPVDDYQRYFSRQQTAGTALLERLGDHLAAARVSELTADDFLGARQRRFRTRLPFVLAFAAEYADWLMRLEPAPLAEAARVRELSAIFNLGIVLVDELTDDGGEQALDGMLGAERLRTLVEDADAADAFARSAGRLPTPELRVLAAVIAAFMVGVQRFSGWGGGGRRDLLTALSAAYAGQRATLGRTSVASIDQLRAKSGVPFMIPPLLVRLASGSDDSRLLALGSHIGEIFWRVDDLIDAGKDAAFDESNLLLRAPSALESTGSSAVAVLLSGRELETCADEITRHTSAVLALVEATPVRLAAAEWLEMYILDWMR